MTRQLILLVLILSIFDPTTAQEDGTRPIRVDNVGNLQMVDVVGRGAITDYAWSMDSFVIAVSSESGLWLYNPMDLNESPIHFDPRPFNTVAYSSDGTYLAAGATDRASQVGCTIYGVNLLSVWNLTTSEMHFEAETSIVNMMFFPKENMILAVNRQSGLEIWDVENGERLAYSRNLVPSGASHTLGGDVILSISPDGDYFSAISYYYRDDVKSPIFEDPCLRQREQQKQPVAS